MSHSHAGHNHHHAGRSQDRRRLAITLAMVVLYMAAEVVGGWLTNSLALLADAGHMLSDAGAIGLSLFALWIAQRPASPRRTYGYYRAEILAALANGATLIAIAVVIFLEALGRFRQPLEVAGAPMLAVAIGGLVVNLIALALLSGGQSTSLNVRGAWLHVLTDALGSVGAIIAAALIWLFGWYWVDPLVSVLIGLLVIYSAWSLLQEAVSVLMESTPRHLDVDRIREAMLQADGVLEVHDLHVWTITSGFDALSAHVVLADAALPHGKLLAEIRTALHDRFGIDHITIQIEPEDLCDNAGCR